ncbi:DUF4214 domain-containing protein [Pigmentiphaga aceris]|uniref:DUF4214 domain-containing protein n=1 Tax=Pigmentiphaga aceris TaxID=1940612 RepID=UPI0016522C17|nr:DUF4214 domain-containing protein [Pigmentiphaga aceris]
MATPTSQQLAIARLYTALFNRAPDADGFAFWLQALEGGATLNALAQSMVSAPEALLLYPPGQTDAQFVTSYYTSVFGRTPDAEGLAFWTAALAAQGGAVNTAARAALTMQIGAIASTPLTSKPEGMSDAAYAQTVADRARFINKTEFGVYFAADLKSNDLALAKSTLALVTDNPASITAATNLARGIIDPAPPEVIPALTAADTAPTIASKLDAYSGAVATVDATGMTPAQLIEVANRTNKIADAGITGALALSNALSIGQITALLGTKTGDASATVNVDASGMDLGRVVALSNGVAKIDSITNLALVLVDVPDVVSNNLLGKAMAGAVTAVVTGASNTELSTLAASITKIATAGITGTLSLSNTQTADELTALLGAQTDATATVTVDVSGMSAAKLEAVGSGAAKVDTLSGLSSLTASALSATAIAGLLSKVAADSMAVDATDATAAKLSALASAIGKITAGGITGTLALSNAQSSSELTALLGAQTGDAAATVTVDATNMDTTQLDAVANGIAKVDTLSSLPAVTSAWSVPTINTLLAKVAAATVSVTATGLVDLQLSSIVTYIDKIVAGGITGTLSLSNSQDAAALTALLGTKTGDDTATVNASSMTALQLNAVGENSAKVHTVNSLPQLVLADLSEAATAGLMGKASSTQLTVLATGASPMVLTALAANIGKVDTAGITGTLNLSNMQLDHELTALLGAQTGDGTATVTVDAGGMNASKLEIVGQAAAKVDTVVGLNTLSASALSATTLSGLLSKVAANTARVDATDATAAKLSALASNIDNIFGSAFFGGGIIGMFTLSNALSDTELSALLGKTDESATVNVNASGMNAAKLEAVAAGITNVDTLTDLPQLVLADLSDTATDALLSKMQTGSTVSVVATGATANELASVFVYIDKIAADGITGTLALTSNQGDMSIANLLSKTPTAATVNVDAAGMTSNQLTAIASFISKVDTLTNVQIDLGVTGNSATENLLAKSSVGSARVIAGNTTTSSQIASLSNHIDNVKVDGITGTLILNRSNVTADQLTALLSTKTADAATVDVNASGMSVAQLAAVGLGAAKVDTLSGLPSLVLGDAAMTDAVTAGLLSKAGANSVSVDATGASDEELKSLADNIGRLATNGITGTLALSSNLTAVQLTALLGAKTDAAATVNVDATGMDLASLQAVVAGIGKVDRLTNLPLGSLTDTQTSDLLTNVTTDGSVSVVATGASANEVGLLVTHMAKIANDGITGDITLTSAPLSSELSSLLQTKIALAANVTIDATGMDNDRLLVVGSTTGIAKTDSITNLQFTAGPPFTGAAIGNLLSKAAPATAKVDMSGATGTAIGHVATYIANIATGGITNLSLSLANVDDVATSALLSKAAVGTAMVVATDATANEATALLGNLTNVSDAGITGTLILNMTQYADADKATLKTKLAVAADPVLRIAGTSGGDVLNLSGWTGILRVDGGAGADAITLNGAGGNKVFIGSALESRGTVVGTESNTNNIDVITGLTGADVLRLSSVPGVFGTNITFAPSTSKHFYFVSNLSANTLDEVWASVSSPLASDNAAARFYSVGVTGGALAGSRFLILNDHDATVNASDTMIALVGSTTTPTVEFGI